MTYCAVQPYMWNQLRGKARRSQEEKKNHNGHGAFLLGYGSESPRNLRLVSSGPLNAWQINEQLNKSISCLKLLIFQDGATSEVDSSYSEPVNSLKLNVIPPVVHNYIIQIYRFTQPHCRMNPTRKTTSFQVHEPKFSWSNKWDLPDPLFEKQANIFNLAYIHCAVVASATSGTKSTHAFSAFLSHPMCTTTYIHQFALNRLGRTRSAD